MSAVTTAPTTPAPNPVREAVRLLREFAETFECQELDDAADALGRAFADPDPATVERCARAGCFGVGDCECRSPADCALVEVMGEAFARDVILALGSVP